MKLTAIMTVISGLCLCRIVIGRCSFTTDITSSRWFYSYGQMQIYNIEFLIMFSNSGINYIRKDGNKEITKKSKCIDSAIEEGHAYILLNKDGRLECIEFSYYSNEYFIIRKQNIRSKIDGAKSCHKRILEYEYITTIWMVKYPFSIRELSGRQILPEGKYHATYTNQHSNTMCTMYDDSFAKIVGNTISLSTCFSGDPGYKTPLQTKLMIIGERSGRYINSTDRMMLLADNSNPNRPAFYCTRYSSSSNGMHAILYLDISYPHQTDCDILLSVESKPTTPTRILQITLSNKQMLIKKNMLYYIIPGIVMLIIVIGVSVAWKKGYYNKGTENTHITGDDESTT